MTNPRADDRDRYITCAVKMNGVENGRTEILDTHIDGGEGEPLIVASFFDRGEAEFFCRAGNRAWRCKQRRDFRYCTVKHTCPVCGDISDADKEHNCGVPANPLDPVIDEDRCSECGKRSLNSICPACQEESVRILNDPTRSHAL